MPLTRNPESRRKRTLLIASCLLTLMVAASIFQVALRAPQIPIASNLLVLALLNLNAVVFLVLLVLESRIGEVLTAIVPAGSTQPNSFDAAAMTAQDKEALATLIGAWVAVQGRATPAERALLKVALQPPPNADGATGTFLSNVAGQLAQLGFSVAATPSEAGIVLKLSAPGIQEGGTSAQGLPQRKAQVRGSMVWTYSGRSDDLGMVTGIGADRDKRLITEAALRSAAQQVANTAASKVEGV